MSSPTRQPHLVLFDDGEGGLRRLQQQLPLRVLLHHIDLQSERACWYLPVPKYITVVKHTPPIHAAASYSHRGPLWLAAIGRR